MEKLVQGDQDKTEQLERLNKENSQLLLTLTQQVESRAKLTFFGPCGRAYVVLSLLRRVTWVIAGSGKGLRGSHLK